MSAPTYERIGSLVAEPVVHRDDDGKIVAQGMFAAELYECGECHALVWWPAIDRHTAWYYPLQSRGLHPKELPSEPDDARTGA